jgi:hypothetical protein
LTIWWRNHAPRNLDPARCFRSGLFLTVPALAEDQIHVFEEPPPLDELRAILILDQGPRLSRKIESPSRNALMPAPTPTSVAPALAAAPAPIPKSAPAQVIRNAPNGRDGLGNASPLARAERLASRQNFIVRWPGYPFVPSFGTPFGPWAPFMQTGWVWSNRPPGTFGLFCDR